MMDAQKLWKLEDSPDISKTAVVNAHDKSVEILIFLWNQIVIFCSLTQIFNFFKFDSSSLFVWSSQFLYREVVF